MKTKVVSTVRKKCCFDGEKKRFQRKKKGWFDCKRKMFQRCFNGEKKVLTVKIKAVSRVRKKLFPR